MVNQEQIQTQSQRQNFFLTQQRLQLLHLMHLPYLALEEHIKNELEENPALEKLENEVDEDLYSNEETESVEPEGVSIEEFMDEEEVKDYKTEISNYSRDDEYYQAPVSTMVTAQEQLKQQVWEISLDKKLRQVIEYLIDSLEEDGYLRRPVSDLADDYSFANNVIVDEAVITEALNYLQQCEPAGVGARSVQECLLLQLKRLNNPDEHYRLALKVIENYFHELSVKNYNKIIQDLSITSQELQEAIHIIARLSPRPLADISKDEEKAGQVTPEFMVFVTENECQISLTSNPGHSVQVNTKMEELINKPDVSARRSPAISHLKKKINAAKWFVEALRTREKTLMDVMHCIVKKQFEFFLTGDYKKLKPMILQDIAEATGYDISTVSRVTSNKYALTNFGNLLLKNLFTTSLMSDSGEKISTKEIREMIADIISGEDKSSPLNDFAIVDKLKEQGMNVARRTVVKYREAMNIPNSRLRRQMN
jgi:RNA polymerase sigma-54 factor